MNHLSIIILSIFVIIVGCDSIDNITLETTPTTIIVNSTGVTTTTEIQEEKPLVICDICQCTVDTINCTGLQLDHHFDNGTWPQSLQKLVTFAENAITHLKPFPNVSIDTLILRGNKITKIDSVVFKKIKNLTTIDLSHNYLTSDVLQPEIFEGDYAPEVWEPLANLRELNLGHNALHTLKQNLFEHTPFLEVLILTANPLGVIDHSTSLALSDLHHLRELNLESCNLAELPQYLFHVHKHSLKNLYLGGNRFDTIPKSLEDAEALESLNLDNNFFRVFDHTNAFPSLPNLKKLSMCSLAHLTRVDRGVFSHLTALEELYLCDNSKLEDINEDALVLHEIHGAIWPPLKTLDISNNKLSYFPDNLVGRWDKLQKLGLTGNEWVCDCDNQYLIGSLLPTLGKNLMGDDVNKLFCSAPPEHAGKNLSSLEHRHLRCVDRYGARPERDAAILVGLLVGLLLAIPAVLILFLLWRRGYLFCGSQNPASFSRAFYKRASSADEEI